MDRRASRHKRSMSYNKRWSPKHAVMCRASIHRLVRAVEKITRQQAKKEIEEKES